MRDYGVDQRRIEDFLRNFSSEYDLDSMPKYYQMLQEISNRSHSVLEIDLNDVLSHTDEDLVEAIVGNTKRFVSIFSAAADEVKPPPTHLEVPDTRLDNIITQRDIMNNTDGEGGLARITLPPSLKRRYEVRFLPLVKDKALPLRKVGAHHVGKMVTCKGIVVRCTDVKPMCTVAVYTCDRCSSESYQEITGREFTPLTECASNQDANTVCKGIPIHHPRMSKFVKFQEVKLQEPAGDVPQGSVPRTLTVHIKGELTRQIKPGDMVTISGIYLPVPFTGYKAMRAGLLAQTYLEAMRILKDKQSYEDNNASAEDREMAYQLTDSRGDVYSRLANSIAPEIFGHEDVKKVLLLLMVGGVTKTTADGMRLRGDIHVCLMGDPGVAKSQLLKQVATISPRSVYTTGKGSSGVGLTAAVQRDPNTGEMVLEGGALVLADKGICCIDEFDKMEEQDRTAIHEAMEQQTVSIAKGGITTTLNTRATVLAAANPVGGSYDPSRTPEENINLPAALLSRFDLLWLLLDKPNEEDDRLLAEHVLRVHQTKNHLGKSAEEMEAYENKPSANDHLPASVIRTYIGLVREYVPCVPEDLANDVCEIYTGMRQAAEEHQVVTARQLMAILRLSQALARLRMDNFISKGDLAEAQRLLAASKSSLSMERKDERTDTTSAIYSRIATYLIKRKGYMKSKNITRLCFKDIKDIVRNSNLPCTDQQIKEALTEYSELGVFTLENRTFDIILHNPDGEDSDMADPYAPVTFPHRPPQTAQEAA